MTAQGADRGPLAGLGPRLAQGRTAEIFAWGEGRVVKLFRPGWPREDAEFEMELARAVQATSFSVPAVYELVEMDSRAGIVYERVDGRPLLKEILDRPWRAGWAARLLAGLHHAMHQCRAPALPSQRRRLQSKIEKGGLPDELKQAALHALEALPDGEAVCHGDFHPDNVLLTGRGPIIIDWIDVTAGHPLADVARTSLLTRLGAPPLDPIRRALLDFLRWHFHRAYVSYYLQLSGRTARDLRAWEAPVAAARSSEAIAGEREQLAAIVRSALAEGGR